MSGTPKWNLFIKNCVFILTYLNFSYLQSTIHLMQNTYPIVFFIHSSKQFLNSLILMPFSASVTFGFTSSTSVKHSLPGLFFTSKELLEQDQVNMKRGYGAHAIFGQKLLSMVSTGALVNHPS